MTTNSADTADTAIAKETVEANGAQSQRTNPPTLRLDNVSYAYAKGGKRVLKNISHDFQAGKVHAITGPSGAGKTTMLSLICGLAGPTEGRVMYNGGDLAKQDRYGYRSHDIGVIFQSFNLLPSLTVAENIVLSMDASGKAFGMPKKERAVQLLKEVHLPAEYANERILHLSGGEQQRVAIARALITKPKLVFADEPTGNLDSVSSAEVLGFLKRSVNELGQTIVMVTHDAVAASYADRAIVFSDGRIVADEQHPNAEVMNELLMAERERTTRTTLTDTPADQMAQMAGVRNVPDLPITDAPLPPAVPTSGCEGTLRHARAAARHAR